MGEYNRIFEPSQTKISSCQDFPPKTGHQSYEGSARILALFRDQVQRISAARGSISLVHGCGGFVHSAFSQGPMHVCILKNIEGLLFLPLIGYNTLAIEVILNSR